MAQIEFETKALEVDTAEIARRIAAAGGEHVADRLMRRFVYDIRPGEPGRWMRLRDTGGEVTLCVKEISADTVDGTRRPDEREHHGRVRPLRHRPGPHPGTAVHHLT
ncbi:hypothetical protein [Actinacidiphila bryophytorum]|uniref:hypothetical protein n=1 Tax=Actinacidiphila bryophytorum TaxID=1436133 RepID=UPI002176C00D|nr:hypothetical protein [Actinacidiphila bryophytorum]UWE07373.1 hypothetical protein NYE86_00570 [Actinacidiphila bryophytorum]